MGTFVAILFLAALVVPVRHYWLLRAPGANSGAERDFLRWLLRGAAVPFGLWLFFNLPLLPGWTPLWPSVALTAGMQRATALYSSSLVAALVITSWWSGITLGWILLECVEQSSDDDRRRLRLAAGIWACVCLLFAGVISQGGGLWWAGAVLAVGLAPAVHFAMPLTQFIPTTPMYSTAVAKMKFGKSSEAEQEVIRELEKCADDYDGWMLLAELYAVHFHDLAAADAAIRELCTQPNVNASQMAVALHRLADWHLKEGDDPPAARDALETISRCYPGTHLDRMARNRCALLPVTREELLEQKKGRVLHLPSSAPEAASPASPALPISAATFKPAVRVVPKVGSEPRLVATSSAPPAASEARDPGVKREAQVCVEKLKRDPNDVEVRERLAHLFAEHLGEVSLGLEQLELLIAMPQQSSAKIAGWLYLMGTWHLRYRRDSDAARALFLRIVREYPDGAVAFEAQRRVMLIDAEARFHRQRTTRVSS